MCWEREGFGFGLSPMSACPHIARELLLRHSSRITRFGLHVVVCCCDYDITWILSANIHLYSSTALLFYFTIILYIYTDATYTVCK